MDVEILSIGRELLLGLTLNQNAFFLSQRLTELGYEVKEHRVVADEREAIQGALQEALKRSSLVIATGGLGPTIDDITLDAASALFSQKPQMLPNSLGTAPGAFFPQGASKGAIFLPGVPREMERMFFDAATPLLHQRFPAQKKERYAFSLCLLKELEVDPALRAVQEAHPEIECGIYPSFGTVQVVLQGPRPLRAIGEALEEKFPTYVYGKGKIEEAVHQELIARQKTLALAESCTGGEIASRLTALPEASTYLLGSLVAYSNAWKERFLHVSAKTLKEVGAVSAEVVGQMVEGLFQETRADFAIAVSGLAGPSSGHSEKPVGTIYLAIGKRGEATDIGLLQAPKDRAGAIDFAVQTALSALWRRLVHHIPTFT